MDKLILNLTAPVLRLDGTPINQRTQRLELTRDLAQRFLESLESVAEDAKDMTLAGVLAQALFSTNQKDPHKALKFHSWAILLAGGGKLDLDKPDLDMLCDFVEGHEGLTIAVKGPLVVALRALKEEAKAKSEGEAKAQ